MKGLQVLLVCCLAAAVLAEGEDANSNPGARTGRRGNRGGRRLDGNSENTRFLGNILGGIGSALTGGHHRPPHHGGHRPPFGGGIGGHRPPFGGGIGGHRPPFGGGIGGHRPPFGGGIGGHRPPFGGGIGGQRPPFGGGGIGGIPGVCIGIGVGVSQTCRRWCRTPKGQAYCCEGNNEPDTLPFVKPGFCPPVRPACPPTRSFAPPQPCSNDSKCGGIDKCCFDTCLQQHVCKPPQGSVG